MNKGSKHPEPSSRSLEEMPEIDDPRFKRRPGQGLFAGKSAGALSAGSRQPIQLQRRFFELKEDTDDELAEQQVSAYALSEDISWSELLTHPCVVVLGEAGTGKTTEFRQRSEALIADGQFAFYMTVQDLAIDGLVGAMRSDGQERFASWKTSSEGAYFFLDAVDEARLNGQTFRRALTKFEQAIGKNIERAHVLISCRVSDWRARSDRREIQSILFGEDVGGLGPNEPGARRPTTAAETIRPHLAPAEDHADEDDDGGDPDSGSAAERKPSEPPRVHVFALAPLDTKRVEALAFSLGVANPPAFTTAARKASAQAFLDRPRDVEWLVTYWLQHGEFGSLTELVEDDVRQKLVERNPNRRSEISPATAKLAAEALSGISRLERKSTFLLPDEDLDPDRAAGSIDPQSVLVDLSSKQLADLLTLPVFDEATYGRVRIHHRTVAEFLAAQWLETLLRAGLSPTEVDKLLFRSGPDGVVVPKELVPVAAWLSGARVDLRKRLVQEAPTVLLEGGDPSSLTSEERVELLTALSKLYTNRKRLFKEFDRDALRRLSSPDIVQTVNELLSVAKSDELLDTLISIVSEGQLADCANEVLRLAASADTPIHARHEAVRALVSVASNEQIRSFVDGLVEDGSDLDHEVAGTIVATLYPAHLDTNELLAIVSRATPPPPQTATSLPYLVSKKVFEDTRRTDRPALVVGIFQLIRDQSEQRDRWWLIDPLANLVAHFARVESENQLEVLRPIFGFFADLAVQHQLDHETGEEEVKAIVSERPDLRRLMFWEHVKVCRKRKPNLTRFIELVGHAPPYELTMEDVDWLTDDARTQPDTRDRLVAFDCMLATLSRNSAQTDHSARISGLTAGDSALAKRWERERAKWIRLLELPEPMWKHRQRMFEASQKKRREEEKRNAHSLIDGIRDGTNEYALSVLAAQAHVDPNDTNKAFAALCERYDETIARAAREGWRNFWRKHVSPLPHDEPDRSRFSFSTVAGLIGITIEFEEGLRAVDLNSADAENAARYATQSINKFPGWLEELAAAYPDVVRSVFSDCIVADYARSPADKPAYDVLHRLSYAPRRVRELCVPRVVSLLAAGDPSRVDTLEQCAEALVITPASYGPIATFAHARCDETRNELERLGLWWSMWLAADPSAAVAWLEGFVATTDDADAIAIALSDRVSRLAEVRRQLKFPFPSDPEVLSRLFALVYRHVRPDDDVRHIGVYSPGPRDHAEKLRRYLFDMVVSTPGEATYRGLKRLAEDPRLASSRDYLLAVADERLAEDAGEREAEVAHRLMRAYRDHGLAAIHHLDEAGLETMTTANVDFGIVTALPDERDAVLAALGSYEQLDKDGTDTHSYYAATIPTTRKDGAAYRVVLVCCPSMGPQVAVATTCALLSRWKPKHVLLVGIAMGVPGETNHGDVLLGDQVADYTLGKQELGKKREIRWKGHLPGASLYDSALALPNAWSKQIKAERPSKDGAPTVVPGTIASGGDVVADDALVADFRERWPKLVGIEMEAGGCATAVHDNVNKPDFLMIKAVSDHGKDKKDPAVLPWREYAYVAAATFAVELIRSGPAPAVKK